MTNTLCYQRAFDEDDIVVESDSERAEERFSIYIGPYEFDGPYNSPQEIREESGVFAVLCFYNKQYELLDIGFSQNLRQTLLNHKDHDYWMEHCTGSLLAAVHYGDMTEADAALIIGAIEGELGSKAA